jgi:hypothetical protein
MNVKQLKTNIPVILARANREDWRGLKGTIKYYSKQLNKVGIEVVKDGRTQILSTDPENIDAI